MAAALVDAGVPVIVDATAHRRAWRELARATIPNFAEVSCAVRWRSASSASARGPGAPRGYL
jgi:predicted kinase